jgi:hypothetical protein
MTSPLDSVRAAREAQDAARVAVTESILAAHAAGVKVAAIAEAAGVTRQRVYQVVAAAKPVLDAEGMQARLDELDEAWECLVDMLAPRLGRDDRRYNAGYPALTRVQNTANGKSAKRGRGRVYTDVRPMLRNLAEAELLLVLEHRGDKLVIEALGDLDIDSILKDLAEAATLRDELAAIGDPDGFFAGI